jgi:hypothetical protein
MTLPGFPNQPGAVAVWGQGLLSMDKPDGASDAYEHARMSVGRDAMAGKIACVLNMELGFHRFYLELTVGPSPTVQQD